MGQSTAPTRRFVGDVPFNIPNTLHRNFLSANAIENSFRNARRKLGRVTRFRTKTDQATRWLAFALTEVEKGLRQAAWPPQAVQRQPPLSFGQAAQQPAAHLSSRASSWTIVFIFNFSRQSIAYLLIFTPLVPAIPPKKILKPIKLSLYFFQVRNAPKQREFPLWHCSRLDGLVFMGSKDCDSHCSKNIIARVTSMTFRLAQQHCLASLAQTLRLLLMVLLAFCTSFAGMAVSFASECESAPTEAESIEIEFEVEALLTAKKSRRKIRQQADRLSSGCLLARLHSHSAEQSNCLTTPALTEHALRNGGIGTSLRC